MLQRENVDVEDTAERGPSANEEELDTIAEREKSEGETLKIENDLWADERERSEGETLKVENDLGADERERSEGETLKVENDLWSDERERSEGETLKVENDLGADERERSEGETLKVENDLGADERERSEGETLKVENDLGVDEREVTLVQEEKKLWGGLGEGEERGEKTWKREVYHMYRHQKCSFSTGGIPWRWFRLPTCGCLQWSHLCPPKLPGTTSSRT
jgi:dihydroneopterin aldolase